eukprot:gene2245-6517_t
MPRPPRRKKPKFSYAKANWTGFVDDTETLFGKLLDDRDLDEKSVHWLDKKFTDIVVSAMKQHIPKGRGHREPKMWWTKEVEAAKRERNRAHQNLRELDPDIATEEEILEAQLEFDQLKANATDIEIEAKRKSWHDFVSELDPRDSGKAFGNVKGSSSAALNVNGKTVTGERNKANEFVKLYASVSRLKTSDKAADNKLKHEIMDALREQTEEQPVPFSETELLFVLENLPRKKSPGPDTIPNEVLKRLGENGRAVLLRLFNTSWLSEESPVSWRKAIICPVLKRGKPATELGSFRPIALTSCIAKCMERLVATRLQYYLEGGDSDIPRLSRNQGGFRRCRSCDEQIARLCQKVFDGFNANVGKRKNGNPIGLKSIATLVDFSRAFDGVWKWALYRKMLDKNIPTKMVRWVRGFLHERIAS